MEGVLRDVSSVQACRDSAGYGKRSRDNQYVVRGGYEYPLTRGLTERPLTRGTADRPLTRRCSDHPLTSGSSDYPLTRGGSDHPLTRSPTDLQRPPAHYVLRNVTARHGSKPIQIKRMKQLEQEKDALLQGLEAVERAREWYLAQIRGVQDKQKYVGKASGHNEYSVESHQERMNFQHARISEVNQQLKALIDSSEKGFPLHMNLALSSPRVQRSENTETSNIVSMLKGQNRLLTQEVSGKSDKIAQLEREKAALIRDLFETRAKHRNNNYEDTTFM